MKKGLAKEARKLLVEMEKRGIKPNINTYNIFIDSLCKYENIKKAKENFNSITETELVPDAVMFNTTIDGLYQGGLLEETYHLFFEVID